MNTYSFHDRLKTTISSNYCAIVTKTIAHTTSLLFQQLHLIKTFQLTMTYYPPTQYLNLVILTVGSLFPFSLLAQPPKAMPMPVEVSAVKLDTVIDQVSAVGSLLPQENVIIRSEIPGRILTIHFTEGQQVTAHQALITLDAAEYQAVLAESDATVNLNRISFERTKDLTAKNLTSHQAFDEAQAKLEQSLARQQLDQVKLAKTKIVAPFAGQLGLRNISQGAYIQAGQDLVTLVDLSTVKLDFRIPEKFLAQVHLGQTVKIQVDAYPNETFSGEVYAIDPTIDQATRTALLRARVANSEGILFAGMFVRVNLELAQRPNAIVIPEQAIVPKGGESLVFKVVNGKAVMTKITLGQRRTGDVEIVHGLSVTDKIVVSGQLKLRDGVPVVIVEPGKPPMMPPAGPPAKKP